MPMQLSPEVLQQIQALLQKGGGAGAMPQGAAPPMGGPAGPGPMAPMPSMPNGFGSIGAEDLGGGGAPPMPMGGPMGPGPMTPREPPNSPAAMGMQMGGDMLAGGGAPQMQPSDARTALIQAIMRREQQSRAPGGRY